MEKTKKRWESTTLIGAIITLVSFIVGLITDKISPSDIGTIITSIFTIIGIVMTMYGRAVATKKIK